MAEICRPNLEILFLQGAKSYRIDGLYSNRIVCVSCSGAQGDFLKVFI